MILYNVTIKVEQAVAAQWLQWMQEEHLKDMMQTGLFSDYRLCRLLEQDESEGVTYVVQYHCATPEQYQEYLNLHASRMRRKGMDKFANQFAAFRTVMEVIG